MKRFFKESISHLSVIFATMLLTFLVTDRSRILRRLRTVTGILSLLFSVGVIALLMVDRSIPRLLLFVSDAVKFPLLGAILWGIFAAILGICCRRAAYTQTILKENSK